jgi:hypothetical protein
MTAEEANRRFKAPFNEELARRAFRLFLLNKELVWDRLNVSWARNQAYADQVWLEMELRAKEVCARARRHRQTHTHTHARTCADAHPCALAWGGVELS